MSKTFKKLMLLPMLAAMMVLMPTACTTNDNPVDDNTTVIDPGNAEFNPTVLTGSTLYVADGVDADLHQAFKWGCGTESSNPEDGWVLVLNKLTDVSEDVLKKAIVDGGYNNLICLVNPVKAEIDAYAESHDWFDIGTENVGDSVFIFGFNSAGSRYVLIEPKGGEDDDPIVANMERSQNYYVMISSMLSDYARLQQNGGNGGNSGSDNSSDLEDFAGQEHFMVSKTFTTKHQFRQALWSDPDYLEGWCVLSASYDVYSVHVYEGQLGAGDYYAIKVTANVASAGMWKGKGDNVHGGVHVRWCGAYCTDFGIETRLTPANVGWFDDTSSYIIYPASGWPTPTTTVGQKQYTDSKSFSLNMSQTVGASKTSKTETGGAPQQGVAPKGSDETTFKGELSFSEGWTWSHTESQIISDVDIYNNTYSNRTIFNLKFNNLPKFSMSETNHYDEGTNGAARSTMDLHGSWLWYDKSGKDNQDKPGYLVRTVLYATYEIQSHYTTEADNEKSQVSFMDGFVYQLPKVENSTGGHIKIKNNLPDGMSLSNIVVTVASEGKEKGKTVSEYRNSVANGDEYEIGFFNNHYEYLVTFKAGKNASSTRTYKYITNPTIKLGNLETVVLNASYDFVPE